MNDPLQILRDDHAQIDRMLAELGATPSGSRRTEMAQAAHAWLVEHRQHETSIVHAADRGGDPGDDAVGDAMTELLARLDDDGFEGALAEVRAQLGSHAEIVERRILPGLHARLGETDWLAMGDALVRAKHPGGLGAPA